MPANMFMRMAFPNVAEYMDNQEASPIITQALQDPNALQGLMHSQSTNPIINQFKQSYAQNLANQRAQLQQKQQAEQQWRDYYNPAYANLLAKQPDLYEKNPALAMMYEMGAKSPDTYKEVLPQIEKLSEGFSLSPGQKRFTQSGQEIASGGEDVQQLEKLRQNKFQNATTLRDRFLGVTAPYAAQNDAYGRIIASVKNPSPAGDMALIYNYMKMLDPQSVVRESEFQMAASTGSLGTQFQNWVDRAMTGKFSDTLRKDIVNRSTKLFNQASEQHKKTATEFSRIANQEGVNPSNVIINRQTIEPMPESQYPPLPEGFQLDK